ncbi:MAG: hypothetical protein HRT64_03265 [Erythrobacter sp.]|nr:hypothetical protein [Erythrobacter sp.]
MSELALETWAKPREKSSSTALVILAAIALVACLQVSLAFSKDINWDEFSHFSQIHAHLRGEPVNVTQTPYIHLYGWVTQLPGSTIEHIQLIRAMILPFELLLVAAIVLTATRFADLKTSLLCGLAYMTAGYAFTQGLALRADVISASLLMTALAIGFHRKLDAITIGAMAVLVLLGFFSTVKATLYLPAFLALAYYRRSELGRWVWIVPIGGVAVAGLIAIAVPDIFAQIVTRLEASADRMFGGGLFPQAAHWIRQTAMASVFSLLLAGFVYWLAKAKSPQKPILALLALPALWPIVYFNSYPYFFAFILPPVAVALAPVIDWMTKRYGALAVTAVLTLNAAAIWLVQPQARLDNQREVQQLVRAAFPEPVTYIDESGMIGDYPRAWQRFASGWNLQSYHAAGEPVYSQKVLTGHIPLLLINGRSLHNIFAETPMGERLFAEDEALLRANYIRHAGVVMVAGKRFGAGEVRENELVATPGEYRVEGGPIRVDERAYEAGEIVALDRANYSFANLSDTPSALRWAAAGQPTQRDVIFQDLFSGY